MKKLSGEEYQNAFTQSTYRSLLMSLGGGLENLEPNRFEMAFIDATERGIAALNSKKIDMRDR